MPAPEITEELKNDLQILKMRSVLDPKRHYKKNDMEVLPKYFQVWLPHTFIFITKLDGVALPRVCSICFIPPPSDRPTLHILKIILTDKFTHLC